MSYLIKNSANKILISVKYAHKDSTLYFLVRYHWLVLAHMDYASGCQFLKKSISGSNPSLERAETNTCG